MTDHPPHRGLVLVVDDSSMTRLRLGRLIEQEHDVLQAASGQECLDMAASRNPDLILLDVMMPDMDGYETCSRLKADPVTRDIPVMFVSASTDEEDETWGLEIGAVDYIQKPFRAAVVLARVRNQIDLKRYREHLEAITSRDELTGLANSLKFREYFGQEWKRAMRYQRELALVLIDVDDFEAFNDVYGHMHGDQTLSVVASAMGRTPRRSSDMVARLGGTHFAVILPETGRDGAMAVAGSLNQAVRALGIPHRSCSSGPFLSVSLGVASTIPVRGRDAQELYEQAEHNLQEAKHDGRNRVVG